MTVAKLSRAAVCAVDLRGDTPLHEAAGAGHVPVCNVLLSARANPNVANLEADTPLLVAARRGYSGVVEVHLCQICLVKAPLNHNVVKMSYLSC